MKIVALSSVLATALFGSASAFVPSQSRFGRVSSHTQLLARKPFITGNWKLNPTTVDEATELAKGIADSITGDSPCHAALFVPYLFIGPVQAVVGDKLKVGAEAIVPESSGAFTGGVSAGMLKSIGVEWALAGHSERRTINQESDEYINSQCLSLLEQGMSVVLCIGESLEEFEKSLVGAVCEVQIKKGLSGVKPEDMSRVVIAYEPVWAIGTGKVATPEIAQDVHATCRNIVKNLYGEAISDETLILYGGSVSPGSVDGLLEKPDIDGALVGGASLSAESFSRIINFQPTEVMQPVV